MRLTKLSIFLLLFYSLQAHATSGDREKFSSPKDIHEKNLLSAKIIPPAKPVPLPIVVTGTVTDSLGKPLQGVTVTVHNSKAHAITDADGKFSITVPSSSTVLVFSSAGYISKDIAAGSETLAVILRANPRELNEVVVTGFGESRAKRSLGYSVTQINDDEIRKTGQTTYPLPSLFLPIASALFIYR